MARVERAVPLSVAWQGAFLSQSASANPFKPSG